MLQPPPPSMQALLLTGHGGPEQLVYAVVPTPAPAPGEVLVRLYGAAVNNTDINLRVGWYSKSVTGSTATTPAAEPTSADAGWAGNALSFPRIQGADGAGTIAGVGPGVDPARLGERVLIDPILRDGDAARYFGSDTPGAFAQYTTVPTANAVRITTTWNDAEIASFPCSYLAALHLVTRARVSRGQRVLITGGSGGVGTAAVQWALARGASVVAVADPTKTSALRALGVTEVIGRDTDPAAHYGADAFDVVLDVVGGAMFSALLTVLRPGGQYATAGAIAGPVVALDLRTLYLKDLTLHGCTIPPAPLFGQLVAAVEDGTLQPLVAATYPLHALAAAQEAFLRKQHVGKMVLTIP